MKAVFTPLKAAPEFDRALEALKAPAGAVLADGCSDSQRIHLAYALCEGLSEAPGPGPAAGRTKLFLTYSDIRAREICEDLRLYDRNAVFFPAKDLIFYQSDLRSREIETERLKCLRRMMSGRPVSVVTTFSALMTPQIPLDSLRGGILSLSKKQNISPESIAARLTALGYEHQYQVDSPGQYALRGDILDIFDLTEENPCRIEFWGDEIDAIRSFDVLSQRSLEDLESVDVFPASEIILDKKRLDAGCARIRREADARIEELRSGMKTSEAARLRETVDTALSASADFGDYSGLEGFIRYFYDTTGAFLDLFDRDRTILFVDEPDRVREHADAVELEFRESMTQRAENGSILPAQMDLLLSVEEVESAASHYRRAALTSLGSAAPLFAGAEYVFLRARTAAPYNNSFEALLKDLENFRKSGTRVFIYSGSRTRAKRLALDLQERGASAFFSEDPDRLPAPGEVETRFGSVRRGFEYPGLGLAVIAETDIFGAQKTKKKKHAHAENGEQIRSFSDLTVGDYVVHESHGIGIYRGIEKIEVDHIAKDYVKIEYGGKDILYVLPTELDALQKYSAGGEAHPKLNRLGTQEWANTRRKVEKAVDEVADDLVELYSKRMEQRGYAFGPDTVWQKEFEELFPFQETEDQLTAIEDTKKDMESPRIMDRLICGDVGYGKTEIAIRAAFKAAQEGKQTAVLVPTTILAQQHYNTFRERMKNYPVGIGILSRFASDAEQKKTLSGLKSGAVDIVIGTHRLLSKDVVFKDLGLLVIDEEQRFGVTHKEKIKKLRSDVDVLTLSATPIPRTLHMSLVGIRDMSLLEEAPDERQPIQTYVMEYSAEMVREAVMRELSRGGQVYYVYNRVNDIDLVTSDLQKAVPEARIRFAHGQMDRRELEEVMYQFINREIDVLVSTTIIETGLDISNVNTIIIHEADKLGLAQLYQLRGRVGRSSRTAYAFLMYKKDRMLKEEAEKRLAAIREFTDLGSGYRIAMRDLEIRGAGSVLGHAQHGHMAAVGYDLYCKMLNTAVMKARGEAPEPEKNTEVKLGVDAFLPDSYIVNERQKLDIYKKIAAVGSTDEYSDMKDELMDRFGEIPAPAQNLLRIALIRSVARGLELSSITGQAGFLRFIPDPGARLRVENIPAFLSRYKGKMAFIAKGTPLFEYSYRTSGFLEKDEEELLANTEEILVRMAEMLR